MHLQLLTGCIKYFLRSQKNTYTCYDVLIDLFTLNKCSRCIEQVFPWIVSVYEKWAQAYKKHFLNTFSFTYISEFIYYLRFFFGCCTPIFIYFFFKLIQTYSFVKRQSNPNLVCRFEAVWTATLLRDMYRYIYIRHVVFTEYTQYINMYVVVRMTIAKM